MNRLRGYLSTSLWALPGVILTMSVATAVATTLLDRRLSGDVRWAEWLFFTGSPEAAREIFSTIAGSMLTITGVVFSITMLVLQLASSQFSPRALRTFLRDAPSKVALGTFVGTFAYALIGLSTVRSTDELEFVPRLTVTIAFVLILASLAMFLHYIHHTARKIQVTSIIKSIGEETIAAIERCLPEEPPDEPLHARTITALPYEIKSRHAGVIQGVAVEKLVHLAQRHELVLELTRGVGSFVPLDTTLFRSSHPLSEEQQAELASHVTIGTERTLDQDIAYGFRELTDIALRALSPAMNDVTTGINVIDALHDLLLRIGRRADQPSVHSDEDSLPRLITQPFSWHDYLQIVFSEIGCAGKDHERVRLRLLEVAASLARELPEDRAEAVRTVALRSGVPMP
jgi:uncharacterized membrane protein